MDVAPEMTSQPIAVRRKMRKGTHSCSECRRRKIRCKFQQGNTSTCMPCAARGSRCIDQRDAIHVNHGTTDTESASSREKVAVFESTIKHQAQTMPHDDTLNLQGLDLGEATVEADERAPFISMLNDTEGTLGDGRLELPGPLAQNSIGRQRLPFQAQGTSQICSTLRSALPDYDSLMSVLSQNGAWWSSFRHKTHAICQGPYEGLAAFAAHAYTSNIPAEVALLVTAYARSTTKNNHLYSLVENLVLSDSAQSYSVENMELVLLLAKAYSDIGQPRQCWLMYRKGLAIAEIMGLYRRETQSLRLKSIWWAFYHGDRFSSLLLGLPYGFNDAHYGPTIEPSDDGPAVAEQRFLLRCAFIAGKVIDRNVMPGKPSSASSMLLDEQMDAIASSMPERWWDLPDELPSSDSEIDGLRDRLLQQYYFFHVRINLHLPFLPRSSISSPRGSHKLACMEASRQLLKRFVILRTRIRGNSIFDCKTSDFVGFMAAVALILGTSNPTSNAMLPPVFVADADQYLIAQVKRIFEREEKENGCKIASQCLRMLEMLSKKPVIGSGFSTGRLPKKITIPYFGFISRDPTEQLATQPVTATTINMNTPPKEPTHTTVQDVWTDAVIVPSAGTDSNNMLEIVETNTYWEFGGLENFQVDDLSSWLDTAMMDIDPEWDISLEGFEGDYSFS